MEGLGPWNGLTIEPSEVVLDEDKDAVLAQTPHWRVRTGSCGGARVVLSSCRSTPLQLELWTVALDTLHQFVAPHPHPNIVQFLGVVTPSEQVLAVTKPPTACIVTEYCPVSLFDVLHRDRISLSRREIALIGIQVLQGLVFLHRKQRSLGVCLTSKKVMMDGLSGVKLRRLGLELILRSGKAPSHLPSPAHATVYEMAPQSRSVSKLSTGCSSSSSPGSMSPPRSSSSGSRCSSQPGTPASTSADLPSNPAFTAITQDLFAFGVLLLEMCAGERPTNELFNRISCAKQIDPVFYSVLQKTLSLGGVIAADERQRKSVRVTSEELLSMLVANEQQRRAEEARLSSSAFPCFVHADRYFAAKEAEQVESRLRDRDQRGEVDLKRLAAVEQELVEEQKNFAILVLQLEQVQKEKTAEMDENRRLQVQVATQEQRKRESAAEVECLEKKTRGLTEELLALQTSLEEECKRAESLQLARISDAEEIQGLLFEILKLKKEKHALATGREEAEAERDAIARKVGGEKEMLEDVEGRLAQAIHRWEEEQRMRRKADRQAEATSRQVLQMEEERCSYSAVLQQSPTGKRPPAASLSYVVALKDKEVDGLSRRLQEALDGQTSLRGEITQYEAGRDEANTEKKELLTQQIQARQELHLLSAKIQEQEGIIAELHEQHCGAQSEIEALKSRIEALGEEVERQAKKKADEGNTPRVYDAIKGHQLTVFCLLPPAEKARQLRQCLTPQCDAPRYLVGVSGYCKECEERTGTTGPSSTSRDMKQQRHRRHRSWDDAHIGGVGVRKSVKNIPIMKLVRALTDRDDTRVEDCNQQQQLLEAVKQLTTLLKTDEDLKDDLPECLAIKALLALMHQHKTSLVLQLECCKCLSVVVFNHDRNRLIVVAEGGVDPVLASMKHFQLEAKMQESSCVLLTNLAHNCGKSTLLQSVTFTSDLIDEWQKRIASGFSRLAGLTRCCRPCRLFLSSVVCRNEVAGLC